MCTTILWSRRFGHTSRKGKKLSCFDLNNRLTGLKEKYPWLKEVNSQSLQSANKNLDNAFTRFFREKKGFPRFKSKKNPVQSDQKWI